MNSKPEGMSNERYIDILEQIVINLIICAGTNKTQDKIIKLIMGVMNKMSRERLKMALNKMLTDEPKGRSPKKHAEDILLETGLLYDRSKLISGDNIVKMVGGFKEGTLNNFTRYKEGTSKYGERAWLVKGKNKKLIIFDAGNDWWQIIKELKR